MGTAPRRCQAGKLASIGKPMPPASWLSLETSAARLSVIASNRGFSAASRGEKSVDVALETTAAGGLARTGIEELEAVKEVLR
jgi:hypothetical protein